jgi:hypothetical protein
MALLTFEGFEAYANTTQLGQAANTTTVAGSINTSTVRTGARSLQLAFFSAEFTRRFTRSGTVVIFGFGAHFTFSTSSSIRFRLFDTVANTAQTGFDVTFAGVLSVIRNTTTLATAAGNEPGNTWMYYEMKIDLASTATGSYELRRNGATVLSATSVQTITGSSIDVNAIRLQTQSTNNNTCYVDDLYVCDGSGSINNDFLGGVRVEALRPDGNHAVGWTPNTGANWEAVDDTTPDDDTTYVSASTTATDLYTLTDLPANASVVHGVNTLVRARKTGSGTATMRAVIDSAGSQAVGPDLTPDLQNPYTYTNALRETDPNTAAAWGVSAVNALRAGVRRV